MLEGGTAAPPPVSLTAAQAKQVLADLERLYHGQDFVDAMRRIAQRAAREPDTHSSYIQALRTITLPVQTPTLLEFGFEASARGGEH